MMGFVFLTYLQGIILGKAIQDLTLDQQVLERVTFFGLLFTKCRN